MTTTGFTLTADPPPPPGRASVLPMLDAMLAALDAAPAGTWAMSDELKASTAGYLAKRARAYGLDAVVRYWGGGKAHRATLWVRRHAELAPAIAVPGAVASMRRPWFHREAVA